MRPVLHGRVRVSMSDSNAGVRFGKFFWDTADNTRNLTRVSKSDTDVGCLTRQKNLDTGVRVTRVFGEVLSFLLHIHTYYVNSLIML
uniref:Uncharacterized protein n=1 Tax=Arundo donax TaxID=35708 RepID=A0A0A9DHL1_ARUDO